MEIMYAIGKDFKIGVSFGPQTKLDLYIYRHTCVIH